MIALKMCFLVNSSMTLMLLLQLSSLAIVDARTEQIIHQGSNIAAKVFSAMKGSGFHGTSWNFQDIKFAINDIIFANDAAPVSLDLRPTSSFGQTSTYSIDDGAIRPISLAKQILVTANPEKMLSVLVVDSETRTTGGFFQKNNKDDPTEDRGKLFTLTQNKGKAIEAAEAKPFDPPAWHCDVDTHEEMSSLLSDVESRYLEDTDSDERHQHRHHDHGGADEHNYRHRHHDRHHHEHHNFDSASFGSVFETLSTGLRGSQRGPLGRRLYYTDAYPQAYTYQVDLYLEIDQAFVDNHGSFDNALEYVDVLVSAANAIYEKEIDTHLNVIHVAKTNRYDSARSASEALSIMRENFAGNQWHENNIDLHHALLGNPLGGGIAYVGALCNSNYGFGLSGNLMGDFKSLGMDTVWDLVVFAHELGHSLGSSHTHNSNAYSPRVDTCGSDCPNNLVDGSGTIMSYCHGCGGMAKVAYTFGGKRNNSGEWVNSDMAGDTSVDPYRVAETMYELVSSRGECVVPTHDIPDQSCGGQYCENADSNACVVNACVNNACLTTNVDCDDGNSCTEDSCDPLEGCTHTPVSDAALFRIDLQTDNYGVETSWKLLSSDTGEIIATGDDYSNLSSFTIERPICSHPCFMFIIEDEWGDGICCKYGEGSYQVFVDGEQIREGGAFGWEESFEFCIGEEPQVTLPPSTTPSSFRTDQPSQSHSDMPSAHVSLSPSAPKSSFPSSLPSNPPSIPTSSHPSSSPIVQTSASPSSGPSEYQTPFPTPKNTKNPSRAPTSTPTRLITEQPTTHPTKTSSNPPTLTPSTRPTSNPSIYPSSTHSSTPTISPSHSNSETSSEWVVLFFNDFENPNFWGNWIDGAPGQGDARRYGAGGIYAHDGIGSIKLRDNSGMASSVYTNDFDVSMYDTLRIDFFYYPRSFDSAKEDFFLEYSTDGGLGWVVVNSWALGSDFENNAWYEASQEFNALDLDSIRLRIRCDATGNNDVLFIDSIRFLGKLG